MERLKTHVPKLSSVWPHRQHIGTLLAGTQNTSGPRQCLTPDDPSACPEPQPPACSWQPGPSQWPEGSSKISPYHLKFKSLLCSKWSFPHSSVGKESACNAGDPSSTPGSGRSSGEGIGYPLQFSWASLVSQLEKNPPAMQETWVQSLGWEHPLEKGKATHSSILAWRIPWTVQSMG